MTSMANQEGSILDPTSEESAETQNPTTQSDASMQNDSGTQSDQELMDELRDSYEKAREELRRSADKLRTEINKFDMEEAGDKARTWVKENPGLAFFMAVGAGMLVGRALTKAFETPPPTFSERARKQSGILAQSARKAAGDVVDRLSVHASSAGEQMADKMRVMRGSVSERAEGLGDLLHQRAGELGQTASVKTNELISSFSSAAERAADSLQEAAQGLTESVKNQKSPAGFVEAFMQTARTVFSAFVFKRLSDWVRERF